MELDRFPRSAKYNPEWVLAGISGAAHPLFMTEWLAPALDLRPGMRVLDLGCGRALSSIFLHREYEVEVWAFDLWFSAAENQQRIHDAGDDEGVHALHGNARQLPFETEFFDSILSIDSFPYYGTDDLYLNYLLRFLKPGGSLGIAGAGLTQEIAGSPPRTSRALVDAGSMVSSFRRLVEASLGTDRSARRRCRGYPAGRLEVVARLAQDHRARQRSRDLCSSGGPWPIPRLRSRGGTQSQRQGASGTHRIHSGRLCREAHAKKWTLRNGP